MTYRHSICACARWEAPYIVEWLSYHKALGFDHVYLYCNDDDPTEFYEAVLPFIVGEAPFVTFHHFPFLGQQFYMYMHYLKTYRHETEWVMFLDIDEFLTLKQPSDIASFMAQFQDQDSVYFHWWFYGNAGFEQRPAGSVLDQYLRRANSPHPLTKTITKTASIDPEKMARSAFWHHWDDDLGKGLKRVNSLGHDMNDYYRDFPQGASDFLAAEGRTQRVYDSAYIAHFGFKSRHDFALRVKRGAVGDFKGQDMWGQYVHDDAAAERFLAALNEFEDLWLRDKWRGLLSGGKASAIVAPASFPNVAIGKSATQSSVSEWSRQPDPEADAAGAISGVPSGDFAFHTDIEDAPWWRADLHAPHRLQEIRVFNRLAWHDVKTRARNLRISLSEDGTNWTEVYRGDGKTVFGGIDGFPLIVDLPGGVVARYVEIGLTQRDYLHLDQIEIYGEAC